MGICATLSAEETLVVYPNGPYRGCMFTSRPRAYLLGAGWIATHNPSTISFRGYTPLTLIYVMAFTTKQLNTFC